MHPDSTNSSDNCKINSGMERSSLQKELNENGTNIFSVPTFLSISEELDQTGLCFQGCNKCKALQLELDRNKKVASCMKQKLIASEQRLKVSKENEELCEELKLMTQNLENIRCELKTKNMELESTCSTLESKLSESLQEQLKLQQCVDSINSELDTSKREKEEFHVMNGQLEMELVQYKSLTVQKMNAEEDLVALKKNVMKKNKKISKMQDQYEKSSSILFHKDVEIKKMKTSFKALLKVLIRFGTKLDSAKLANKKDKKLLQTYVEKLENANNVDFAVWDDSQDENCTSSELENSPQKCTYSGYNASSSKNKDPNKADITGGICSVDKNSLSDANIQITPLFQQHIKNEDEDSTKSEQAAVNISNGEINSSPFQKPSNTLNVVSNMSPENTSNFYVESSFSSETIKVNSEVKPFDKENKLDPSPINGLSGLAHLSNSNNIQSSSVSTIKQMEEKNFLDPTSSSYLSNVKNPCENNTTTKLSLVKSNDSSNDVRQYCENESFGLPSSSNGRINVSQNFLFKRYLKQPFAECQSNSDLPVVDDGLDISIGDLDNLKQQICLNTEQLAPLSPLPPTPPPNNRSQQKDQKRNPALRNSLNLSANQMDSNSLSNKFLVSDPPTSQHNENAMLNEKTSFTGLEQRSIPSFSSSTAPNFFPLKRHNLCHQQSEGFEVQRDPTSSPVQSFESFDSRPNSASGRVPHRVCAKRCHDGSIKLDMNLQNHSLCTTQFEIDVETGQVSFIFSPSEVKPSTFSPVIINNSTPHTSIQRMETNSFDCIQANESKLMANEQAFDKHTNTQIANLNHSTYSETISHACASVSDKHRPFSKSNELSNSHNASNKSIQNLTSTFTREQSSSPKSIVSSSAENSFIVKSRFNLPSKLNSKFSEYKTSQNLFVENEMKKHSSPKNHNSFSSHVLDESNNPITSLNYKEKTIKSYVALNKNHTKKLASNNFDIERKSVIACESIKVPELHDNSLHEILNHKTSSVKNNVEVSTTEEQESRNSKALSSAFIDHQYHINPNKRILRSRKDKSITVDKMVSPKFNKAKKPKLSKKIKVETNVLLQSPTDKSESVMNSNEFHNFELADENDDKNASGNSEIIVHQYGYDDLCAGSEEKKECAENGDKTKNPKLIKTKTNHQHLQSFKEEVMNKEVNEPSISSDIGESPCKSIGSSLLCPEQSNINKNDTVSVVLESPLCSTASTHEQNEANFTFINSHKDSTENVSKSAFKTDKLQSVGNEPSKQLLDLKNEKVSVCEEHTYSSQNVHSSNSNNEMLDIKSSDIVSKKNYTEQLKNENDAINKNLLDEHKMQVDYDSSGDDMLVIAEDSVSFPREENENYSEKNVNGTLTSNGIKDELNSSNTTSETVVPQKRKPKKSKAKKKQSKKKKQPTQKKEPPQPPIIAALEVLDKLKFNDSHHKQYTHNLFCALVNPSNAPSAYEVVLPLITHLAASKRNPMIPYMASKDPSDLLPLIESCVVSCLIDIENKKKPHLSGLLKTTLNSLYFSILTKKMITVYGLASLCRVLCFLCKKTNDIRTPFYLCCTLLKVRHKFAPYLIASVASVWPEMLKQTNLMTDGNSLFMKVFMYTLFKKPKELTETLWKQCTVVLNEICHVFKNTEIDLIETAFDILKSIKEKVFGENYDEEEIEEYSTSLVILAVTEGWEWFDRLLLNNHVQPMILELMHDNNIESQHRLNLMCNMFVDISYCVELENKHPQVFWSSITSEIFTNGSELSFSVQESLICALMKLYIMKSISLTKTLQEWLSEHQKLICEKKIASVYKVHHWKDSADSDCFRVEDFNLDKIM